MNSPKKTAAFVTLGCKINQYETEAIREQLVRLGYDEIDAATGGASADICIVNTCSVTATAASKSRRSVLRASRRFPGAQIIVVGCSTAREKEQLAEIPRVALVVGNEEKGLVASYLAGAWRPGEPVPDGKPGLMDLEISRWSDRTRATIKVQDGCDTFCSFCIVPRLRGRSRSRAPDAVVDEARRLAEAGYREIVVSGVHLQDYGSDLDPPLPLPRLLARVAEVPGLRRIRLSSLGTRAFTPEMIDLLENPIFCRHWHVPIQAGADPVLVKMRRGYTLDAYLRTLETLRQRFDEPAITTDVIVGHPGETAELFEQSLDVYRRCRFSKIHIFPFSARDKTLAAKQSGRVDGAEIRRRVGILGILEEEIRRAYWTQFVGRTLEVLVEGDARGSGEGMLEGLTERYLRVSFPAPADESIVSCSGSFRKVTITALTQEGLLGKG